MAYFTTSQASKVIGVSQSRVTIYIRTGRLPAVKVKGNWRIRKSDLDKLIKQLHRNTSIELVQDNREKTEMLGVGDDLLSELKVYEISYMMQADENQEEKRSPASEGVLDVLAIDTEDALQCAPEFLFSSNPGKPIEIVGIRQIANDLRITAKGRAVIAAGVSGERG